MSGPNFYSFVGLEPAETVNGRRAAATSLQQDNGATFWRVTIINDDYPNEPYPHGLYIEGWLKRPDVPPPFDFPLTALANPSPPITDGEV